MTRALLQNPDSVWPNETMSVQMAARQIDALNALCPVPTMAEILAELRAEREAEEANDV